MTTKQAQKYHKSLAGEFFVAAQLQRLGIHATVTYGNAKGADVLAVSSHTEAASKALVIEVKTSDTGRWPVGNRVPAPSGKVWVFVDLPPDTNTPPSYYVMTQAELHATLKPEEDRYLANFKAKHGRDYGDKPGVATMKRPLAIPFMDQWDKVKRAL